MTTFREIIRRHCRETIKRPRTLILIAILVALWMFLGIEFMRAMGGF